MTDIQGSTQIGSTTTDLFERIRNLDRKFAWSFLSVVLALIFGAVGVYVGFFQERKPDLKFEIISNTSVLDVHENIGKLDILFAGSNIKQSGQALRVITLRVINDGQMDILKTFYDENDPVGFVLVNGTIVDQPEVLHTSNDYLGKNLRLNLESPQKITFSNVILETNEFYTIKLLVLCPQASIPDLSPIGKVAGVRSIQVTRLYRERNDESFARRTFGGTTIVQVVRIPAYGIVFVIAIILLMIILITLSKWFEKRRRKRLVSQFKRESKMDFNQGDNSLFQAYIDEGGHFLLSIDDHFVRTGGGVGVFFVGQDGQQTVIDKETRGTSTDLITFLRLRRALSNG